MPKCIKIAFICFYAFTLCPARVSGDDGLFLSRRNGAVFSGEVSMLIEKAWKDWQDSVLVNNVSVEGSYGILSPGDLAGAELRSDSIMAPFDRTGKPQYYIRAVKAVADGIESGMRLWQRGYEHNDIPFPQGASCSYTLPPCNNIPVSVASGSSSGDSKMTEGSLFNYMLYRVPTYDEDAVLMMRAAARGIAETFEKWKKSCSIVGIRASGGIAPQPAPMGTGPGPVRGARGYNGKLIGPYFDGEHMYKVMMTVIESG